MYQLKCSSCGHEEAGTFSPPSTVFPALPPVTVLLLLGEAPPTAANLFSLSKLSPFSGLSPAELKASFLTGTHKLGPMGQGKALQLKAEAEKLGFKVELIK
jgi:hypothetical protein